MNKDTVVNEAICVWRGFSGKKVEGKGFWKIALFK